MTRWRNICCGVDFYAPSWLAMEHAAALAKRFGAELTLVHVLGPPPPIAPTSDDPLAWRVIARRRAEDGERMLERWAADAASRAGRPVRARVLRGDPAEALVLYAREVSADLLVVGARRAMGMTSVMSSLAGRLSRGSPCPVIVVHDHARREKEREAEEAVQWQ